MTEENSAPNSGEHVIADYANQLRKSEMEGLEMVVRKARNALFWAGGLIVFWELLAMYRSGLGFDPIDVILAFVIGGIFIALAFWTKKKPYTAVVCGLIWFICIILLTIVTNGIAEGSSGVMKAIVSGIIIKVIILVNLIRPLGEAKALQQAMKEQY
jgi:peptidoglycan/LPS O-acetylase OafA/YrhL